MNRFDRGRQHHMHKQAGTTLIVALVLVLLASLLSLFALNVGVFEQRTSANDVRARLVQQAAEAGLSQGVEYFRNNRTLLTDPTTSAVWELCHSDDTSFPCGTVEQCAPPTASTCSTDLQRRGNMYRYIGKAGYDVNGEGTTNDTIDNRSLPLSGQMTLMSTVGNGFAVNYGAGALLCMVKTPALSTDPTQCTTNINKASSIRLLTMTGLGAIPGENAKTTLTAAYGMQSVLNSPTNKPPVVASGSIDVTGGIQVVTNPDAAGNGVPVSVWTRKPITKTGTPNTCYFDDFIRNQKTNAHPALEPNSDGSTSDVIACDTCECSNSISYQSSGNSTEMGIDLLDIDNVPVIGSSACTAALFAAGSCKANVNVVMDPTIPQFEFPCDMFQYTFGVQAWEDDSSPKDGFCETQIPGTTKTMPDGITHSMGADEAYLYTHATYILPDSTHASWLASNSQVVNNCNTLLALTRGSTPSGGLIWIQDSSCNIGSNVQVGTPDHPVVVVIDGGTVQFQGRMFGLLFIRSTSSPLDPATGGTASYSQNAGSVIYGSLVVQGQITKANGTASVVYNKTVLSRLLQDPALNPFSPVPGSWTDRFAY